MLAATRETNNTKRKKLVSSLSRIQKKKRTNKKKMYPLKDNVWKYRCSREEVVDLETGPIKEKDENKAETNKEGERSPPRSIFSPDLTFPLFLKGIRLLHLPLPALALGETEKAMKHGYCSVLLLAATPLQCRYTVVEEEEMVYAPHRYAAAPAFSTAGSGGRRDDGGVCVKHVRRCARAWDEVHCGGGIALFGVACGGTPTAAADAALPLAGDRERFTERRGAAARLGAAGAHDGEATAVCGVASTRSE